MASVTMKHQTIKALIVNLFISLHSKRANLLFLNFGGDFLGQKFISSKFHRLLTIRPSAKVSCVVIMIR